MNRSARPGPNTDCETPFHASGIADLNSILDYIAAHSPQGETRVQGRIQGIIGLLLSHPDIGIRTDDPTIRRLATPPYPLSRFLRDCGDRDHHSRGSTSLESTLRLPQAMPRRANHLRRSFRKLAAVKASEALKT